MTNDLMCTVASLVPFEIRENKPGLIPSIYTIPESDGENIQILHVGTAIHYVYLDDTRGSLQVRDPSTVVAKSIVDDYCGSQLAIDEDTKPGLFWVTGELSASEILEKHKIELTKAKIHQKRWLVALCRIADNDWNKYHQHNVVSDFQRKAAHIIGWKEEEHVWMSPKIDQVIIDCPGCGTTVKPGIAVCPTCHCVLDKEKHKELTFA